MEHYLCPSDFQDELIWVGGPGNLYTNHEIGIAFYKTNVGGMADIITRWKPPDANIWQCNIIEGDGMFYNLYSVRIRDVFDGTSNTSMVGELTGGEQGSHGEHQGVHLNVFSAIEGINDPATIPGEGFFQRIVEDSFSSCHPGGCHFLSADGSVKFESENIDQDILATLTTRKGGEVIPSNEF